MLSPELPSRRRTVLIVEDDDDLRHMFRDALKFGGFDVCEASDGPEALRVIENCRPDLVVLDVRLPTLDGVSVREEIAGNPQTRDMPVVMVTGVEGFERMDGAPVLRKPVTPHELVATVRHLLRMSFIP